MCFPSLIFISVSRRLCLKMRSVAFTMQALSCVYSSEFGRSQRRWQVYWRISHGNKFGGPKIPFARLYIYISLLLRYRRNLKDTHTEEQKHRCQFLSPARLETFGRQAGRHSLICRIRKRDVIMTCTCVRHQWIPLKGCHKCAAEIFKKKKLFFFLSS